MSTTHKIPTLAELHKDNPDAFANDQLKTLLNMPVNQAWLKKHPISGHPYLPVDKVDYLLDRIYGRWELQINSIAQIENSVVAHVTLKLWNPGRGEWDYQDGAGAMPIQVDSQTPPADMQKIKSNGVQLAVPAAVSYAKKDAADNLGTIFGRNVTRKDSLAFDPTFKEDPFIPEEKVDQPPPPPPPLPSTLASKIVNQPSQPAIQETPAPVVDFTPPVFDANAFAAPVTTAQAPATGTPSQVATFPDLNTKLDF
jgi:hypothetical protein